MGGARSERRDNVGLPGRCDSKLYLAHISTDMITEADTCRKYVLPKLYAAGWNDDQISEQKSFTDGRIVVVGNNAWRRPSKRADYLLRYARDFMLAVVEAKAAYKLPGDGLTPRFKGCCGEARGF
jgi:type I site-specific restriction endonuclease